MSEDIKDKVKKVKKKRNYKISRGAINFLKAQNDQRTSQRMASLESLPVAHVEHSGEMVIDALSLDEPITELPKDITMGEGRKRVVLPRRMVHMSRTNRPPFGNID